MKIDTIIHLAAYGRNLTCRDFPQDAWHVNVHGTRNVLMVAEQHRDIVKRVVVCSSNIVLSDQPTEYKFTKRAAEREVEWFAAKGVSCMGLRPANIYGAGQSKTEYQMCAFASLDECYRKNGHFEISGDGTQTRDWVHAEDVARAFELAAQSDISGVTLDVCTGLQTSMNEIAGMLHVPVKYVDPRPGDAHALISDPHPAAGRLHFWAKEVLQDRIFDAFPSVPREVSA
jgi:UDP-glucose 4-epimerase